MLMEFLGWSVSARWRLADPYQASRRELI